MNRVEVKICGLTNTRDAAKAIELGADYIGFVAYERSRRAVTPEQLAAIAADLGQEGRRRMVAVVVNMPRADVERMIERSGIGIVQLHGDEKRAEFLGMGANVWRAVKLDGGGAAAARAAAAWCADRYVVDASAPGMYGGTGQTADWAAAAIFASRHPTMLAGGLTPDNVAEAVAKVSPLGVDTAGGVESVPGMKDVALMKRFIQAARGAAQEEGA